jgi:hypothetical protein
MTVEYHPAVEEELRRIKVYYKRAIRPCKFLLE